MAGPVLPRDDASQRTEPEQIARPGRLLCVYQHAPSPGAPGIYRHRRYFAELVRRGWHVDLVSTPRNYMTGLVPPEYRRRAFRSETIDGIAHHWVWTPRRHPSLEGRPCRELCGVRKRRCGAGVHASPPGCGARDRLPRCRWPGSGRYSRGGSVARGSWKSSIWPESAVSVGWLSEEGRAYRLLSRFARSVTRRAAVVIVPTPGLEPLVRAHGAREICVLPGIVSAREPDSERRRRLRTQLGVGDDQCLFLYLGAIGVANGLDLLLDAVESLPSEVPARVVVAGDGSARSSFAEAVGSRGLDQITLLPPVTQDGVADLLAAADVGLHLLRPDPVFASALPTQGARDLGAGLPFMTTVPGLPSEVAVASGGAAVSSAAELARELVAWAEMPVEERRLRGQQALGYGLDQFGLEASVDRLEGLLDHVRSEPRDR